MQAGIPPGRPKEAWHLLAACSQAWAAGIWREFPAVLEHSGTNHTPYIKPVPHTPPAPVPPSSAQHNTEDLCASVHPHHTHITHTHTQRGSCKYNSRIQSSAGGKVHQALGCLLGSVWHLTQALSHKLPIIHCYWRDSSTHFKVYSSAETSTVLVSVLWKRSPLCPFKFGYRPRCCAELELFLQLESIVVSFPQEHHGTCKESPRVLAALVTRC